MDLKCLIIMTVIDNANGANFKITIKIYMKLLIFNEDHADEHNVPALAVMTDEKYEIWCKKPSGNLNPNYEKEKKECEEYEQKNKDFWKLLEDKGYTLNGRGNTSMIPKTDLETLQIEKDYRKLEYVNFPKKVNSNLRAYLGNGGDCFEEAFEKYYLLEEFVTAGIVKVIEVTKEFCDIFNSADLSSLSLCNIFDLEDLEEEFDEDEEENED